MNIGIFQERMILMSDPLIKKIEDMSLNAWPSHKMELYDGWILRFSYFYTHRTNSVEQFGTALLPWREKIPYCEAVYKRLGTPAIFKISPLVSPDFDYMLENRGYTLEHVTDVMTLSLGDKELSPAETEKDLPEKTPEVLYSDHIPSRWIEALFTLKCTTDPRHRAVVPSMYAAIPKETVSACILSGDEIIATGLGILDREYIGIYAIHVREDYRRRGYARAIVEGLLQKGRDKGASHAYLQVTDGNHPARSLYETLGFRKIYTYWFRVQPDRLIS